MIARLSSVWLQTAGSLWLQTIFVCVIANTAGYVMTAKKSLNRCVITTILRVWLQPKVICGCNMTESVWLKLLGYLVIYDCKSEQCVFATILCAWLQP
jgi:hypothetical protein